MNTSAVEWNMVQLECRLRGYPNPEVAWLKDGGTFSTNIVTFMNGSEVVISY